MRSVLLFSALAAIISAGALIRPAQAEAAPWMFNQSYYSHTPPVVQPNPQADPRIVGGPLYSSPQGVYLRGQWRLSRTQINVRGRTVDTTYHWESWVQGGRQY